MLDFLTRYRMSGGEMKNTYVWNIINGLITLYVPILNM
jgi:hypothetical protein